MLTYVIHPSGAHQYMTGCISMWFTRKVYLTVYDQLLMKVDLEGDDQGISHSSPLRIEYSSEWQKDVNLNSREEQKFLEQNFHKFVVNFS